MSEFPESIMVEHRPDCLASMVCQSSASVDRDSLNCWDALEWLEE